MDLGEFLLARISEDEAVATTARERNLPFWVAQEMGRSGGSLGQDYVNRFSPDRVLAECEAKRRIVEEHRTIAAAYPGTTIETDPCCETCSAGGEYPGGFPCPTLRLLALPYVDHPDFQQDWKV